jgi:hypothetical protein
MSPWQCVLELDQQRNIVSGSSAGLVDAIGRGADLRVGTEFRHNEHIDLTSPSNELIREVAEFGVTYLIGGKWAAGVMSLRQPIQLPVGFGPRASMSFFLYNMDGTQAIARPFLDGAESTGAKGSAAVVPPEAMPRYHQLDSWDDETNAPSHNFVYDFDHYRFHVSDTWREVLSHSSTGEVRCGSVAALIEAFSAGSEVKLAVGNVCSDLAVQSQAAPDHELFIQGGSSYYYTDQQLFIIGTHPIVRICPSVPLRYSSDNWDFGWLMVRTDGHVVYRRCDPYSLQFTDQVMQCAVRWFVR